MNFEICGRGSEEMKEMTSAEMIAMKTEESVLSEIQSIIYKMRFEGKTDAEIVEAILKKTEKK